MPVVVRVVRGERVETRQQSPGEIDIGLGLPGREQQQLTMREAEVSREATRALGAPALRLVAVLEIVVALHETEQHIGGGLEECIGLVGAAPT